MKSAIVKTCIVLLSIFTLALSTACQSDKKSVNESGPDLSDQLGAGADLETIADHLLAVRKAVGVTRALSLHYPDMTVDEGYRIQMIMLDKLEKSGERLVGWKMGGAQVTDPQKPFEPVFGFMLASNEFKSGGKADHKRFVNGSPLIEAETGFVLKEDLRGPDISIEDVKKAVKGVGGFSELISIRLKDADAAHKTTPAQSIADGLSHGGFIQPDHTYGLTGIDLEKIKARVKINGAVKASGDSENFKFFKAIQYLGNTLAKYNRYLHVGDIIITGSMVTPPPAKKGDTVEILFSEFDPLRLTFE